MQRAAFSAEAGLLGDDWLRRHGDEIEAQITMMNSRVAQLLAGDKARWAEAGDQLFVDLDISQDNLPPGTRIQLGEVVMQISTLPHTGCTKFARRFGGHARKWTATDEGARERRRGVYAHVIQGRRDPRWRFNHQAVGAAQRDQPPSVPRRSVSTRPIAMGGRLRRDRQM